MKVSSEVEDEKLSALAPASRYEDSGPSMTKLDAARCTYLPTVLGRNEQYSQGHTVEGARLRITVEEIN